MVARSPRDVIDYFDDNTENEDETPFLPVRPEGAFLNPWSGFYGGLLIGLAGGGLATLAPWLAGLLIFTGYGMTALTLRRTRRRLLRSFGLGFGVIALAGAAVVLGEVFFPRQHRRSSQPPLRGIRCSYPSSHCLGRSGLRGISSCCCSSEPDLQPIAAVSAAAAKPTETPHRKSAITRN